MKLWSRRFNNDQILNYDKKLYSDSTEWKVVTGKLCGEREVHKKKKTPFLLIFILIIWCRIYPVLKRTIRKF